MFKLPKQLKMNRLVALFLWQQGTNVSPVRTVVFQLTDTAVYQYVWICMIWGKCVFILSSYT